MEHDPGAPPALFCVLAGTDVKIVASLLRVAEHGCVSTRTDESTHTDREVSLNRAIRCLGLATSAVLAVLSTSGLAFGQPWSGILAPSRAIDWGKAGLPAMLPDGETTPNSWTPPTRTKVCATIAPEGTSTTPVPPTDLNAAIQNCPAGQVVELQGGNYYFSDSVEFYCQTPIMCALNSVTVRGAGADKTKIYFSGSASLSVGGNQGASYFPLPAAPAAGATTIELPCPSPGRHPRRVFSDGGGDEQLVLAGTARHRA